MWHYSRFFCIVVAIIKTLFYIFVSSGDTLADDDDDYDYDDGKNMNNIYHTFLFFIVMIFLNYYIDILIKKLIFLDINTYNVKSC